MCTRSLRSSLLILFSAAAAFAQVATSPAPPSRYSIYEDIHAGKTDTGMDVHVLALEKNSGAVETSHAQGRWYTANAALGDPKGFGLYFVNNLGLYEIGDTAPMGDRANITVVTPRTAHITVLKDSTVVAESDTNRLTYAVKAPGRYRAIVSVTDGAGRREWIRSQPLTITGEPVRRPGPAPTPAKVERIPDLPYSNGDPKQKLDVYRPRDSKKAPVLFFVHGGYWRGGDRSQYVRFGERFASEDVVTVIPSYRLQPANPHPAQIDDVAAAFEWTFKNIAKYGGDPGRIYIAGHSAGGHLVALLATDSRLLAKHDLSSKNIKGVVSISGVFDVRGLKDNFGPDLTVREQASPVFHVRGDLPPFVLAWAQWDYPTLPDQAKQFNTMLTASGVDSKVLYVPGEDHVSEIFSVATKPDDAVARAILKMVR